MKRHETLVPLSREHHGALILARLLQKNAPTYKGLPEQPAAKLVYAIKYYTEDLLAHFVKEEVLLQQVKKYDKQIEKLMHEIIKEHRQLSTMFNTLHDEKDLPVALDKLGALLEEHIRKEERVLFPLIQDHCPEEILTAIEW